MITFIAGWILKEKITLLKLGGLLMGVTGAAILIASGKNNGTGNNTLIGDLLVILSTVSYTFYFILVRPLMKKYDSLDVMRWVFTIGFIFILPLGWNELGKITWPVFGVTDYLLLFLLVVPGTFLAYIFNVYGIKILGASVAGTYIYSQPVFAVITAAIFLNESLDIYRIIAGLLIFCGVYLANKQVAKE
jgi:drug/metabolite transporter (DMT)-like permease